MSDKEKTLVERVAEMPEAVKRTFLTMAEGAATALDALKEAAENGHADGGGAAGAERGA